MIFSFPQTQTHRRAASRTFASMRSVERLLKCPDGRPALSQSVVPQLPPAVAAGSVDQSSAPSSPSLPRTAMLTPILAASSLPRPIPSTGSNRPLTSASTRATGRASSPSKFAARRDLPEAQGGADRERRALKRLRSCTMTAPTSLRWSGCSGSLDRPPAVTPVSGWSLEPARVRISGFGPDFDTGSYEQNGHIRIDFGTDTPWAPSRANR